MKIDKLKKRTDLQDVKVTNTYVQFDELLRELRKRDLKEEVVNIINSELDKINTFTDKEKKLKKQVEVSQSLILKIVEKEHKLVPINHYKSNRLGFIGIAVGGAVGSLLGLAWGNLMAPLAVCMAWGWALSLLVGKKMDKKAFEEGRQLNVEIATY